MRSGNGGARRVLVLDGDQGAALSIVRSLGRLGHAVDVAADRASSLASWSRHARQRWCYPDPLRDEGAFVGWLRDMLAGQPHDLVIPVTERTLLPAARALAPAEQARVAMAPRAALEQVVDKQRTMDLARTLDVPVPLGVELGDLAELDAACAQLAPAGWPVVVKPSRSVGHEDGRRVPLSVGYAADRRALEAAVRHALRFGRVLLQEYFRGDGVGVELIADRGEIRHAFQHRRLHEVPLTGGGSSLRVSEAPTPALLQASERLVRALGWHGVAMVEFKLQRETGTFRLMEINGRFWGSLPLAVAAGADFPAMLLELWTQGRVADRPPARAGVLCRHLGRDLAWLEAVLRRDAPAGLVALPGRGELLRDAALVLSPRHHFDIQSWRDPMPGLVDLGRIAAHHGARLRELLARRRFLRRQWRMGRPGGRAARQLQAARTVLFVCHGNINRSALAQAYAEQRHPGRWHCLSAGFHPQAGRPADARMADIAREHGVEMQALRSATLTAALLRQAEVVLVMEQAHAERLQAAHPEAASKVFLLGAAAAKTPAEVEIDDPYARPEAVYRRIFERVARAVDACVALADGARR
ncbi:MAG: hypothetical protein ABS84_02725 [Rubrivivax sp. SCN 71-131]|nr:MAG: hypothetical protein ABS84_02725 [Rubrivivax sp. SCN 71-131]